MSKEETSKGGSTGSTPPVLTGFLERMKKYTKKWGKRYCTFDTVTRKFTYSEEEKEGGTVKAALIVSKLTRLAEQRDFTPQPGSPVSSDLLVMSLEGQLDSGAAAATFEKPEPWNIKFPSQAVFDVWYEAMRRSLAIAGLMDPFNYGLPPVDPRQNLPFAQIPLTHLLKFGLLEKAIIYSFTLVRYYDASSSVAPSCPDGVVVVGDKVLYMFRPNADVLRCTQLTNIQKIFYTKDKDLLGIVVNPPEADIILQCSEGLEQLKHVLSVQYRAMTQGKHLPVTPMEEGKLEQLGAKLRSKPDEGYKLEVASPTAKGRLKNALDQYEKQEGVKFDPSTHRARKSQGEKRQNSVGLPSGASSPGGPELDASIPLVRLLQRLELAQYAGQLLKQHVDLDVLQCMDLTDLETFGVRNREHGQKILDAANNPAIVSAVNSGSAAPATTSPAPPVTAAPSTAPTTSTTAGASPNARPPAITLSDDEDDLDAMMQSQASPRSQKPVIVLDDDDDDDDLDLLPPVSAASPAKPAAAAAAIVLDDDDI